LSNNKCEQLLPSSIIGSWRFFRARVDQLHVSNNASHIFFSIYFLFIKNSQGVIKIDSIKFSAKKTWIISENGVAGKSNFFFSGRNLEKNKNLIFHVNST
jgi:hypothetical protein